MDKKLLESHLSVDAGTLLKNVLVYDELDSTSSEAARLLEGGDAGASLIIADSQSAGRGRRGRDWISPAGSGLYMSMSYPFEIQKLQLQALSLVAAICVCEALRNLGFSSIQLKWPNDLLVGKKKLAGILLEMRKTDQFSYIVFGIGVNYALSDEHKAELGRPVTDLREMAESSSISLVRREVIAARLCSNLLSAINQFLDEGFKPFQSAWNDLDRYFGSDIVVDNGVQRLIGKSLGVDEDGVLQLLTAKGHQKINAGEIFPSLRAADEAIDQWAVDQR